MQKESIYKGKEIKSLTEPLRTNMHPKALQHRMRGAKDGQMSNFLKGAYGCGVCVLKQRCPDFPSAKGICITRSRMYATYLKAGKGEILPIMKDQLAKHSMERDLEHLKGIEQGQMTEDFFRHAHLCVSLAEKINKAEEGIKVNVEHTHTWIDEIREAINVKGKVIDVDNNSGEQGAEEGIPEEVPDSEG